jgi:hypothetical protein
MPAPSPQNISSILIDLFHTRNLGGFLLFVVSVKTNGVDPVIKCFSPGTFEKEHQAVRNSKVLTVVADEVPSRWISPDVRKCTVPLTVIRKFIMPEYQFWFRVLSNVVTSIYRKFYQTNHRWSLKRTVLKPFHCL